MDTAADLGSIVMHHYHPERYDSAQSSDNWMRRVRQPSSTVKKLIMIMVASAVMMGESKRFKEQVCSIEAGTYDTTCEKNLIGLNDGKQCIVDLQTKDGFSSLPYYFFRTNQQELQV